MDLPDQYMIHLNADSFKRMKSLKILVVQQHLPNNLRLLDWMEYPSLSLPSSFYPKKLVVLKLSHSYFTMQELFKVRFHFMFSFVSFSLHKTCNYANPFFFFLLDLDSLMYLDLSHYEFLTKLLDISMCHPIDIIAKSYS